MHLMPAFMVPAVSLPTSERTLENGPVIALPEWQEGRIPRPDQMLSSCIIPHVVLQSHDLSAKTASAP